MGPGDEARKQKNCGKEGKRRSGVRNRERYEKRWVDEPPEKEKESHRSE